MKILVCDPFNQVADIKQKQYRRVFYNKEFFKKNSLIFSKKKGGLLNFYSTAELLDGNRK